MVLRSVWQSIAGGVGGLASIVVVGLVAGTAISLLTINDLLLSSSWTVRALVVFGLLFLTACLLVLTAGPSSGWRRTPYW